MNKDEALKMAIEAMGNYQNGWIPDEMVSALLARKEALEQPEPRMFLDLSNSNGNHPVEQPAQEPFGYWHVGETEEECDFFLYEESGDVTEYCDTCIKLYTHPAPSCQECENLKHDLEGYMDANKELINLLNKL